MAWLEYCHHIVRYNTTQGGILLIYSTVQRIPESWIPHGTFDSTQYGTIPYSSESYDTLSRFTICTASIVQLSMMHYYILRDGTVSVLKLLIFDIVVLFVLL